MSKAKLDFSDCRIINMKGETLRCEKCLSESLDMKIGKLQDTHIKFECRKCKTVFFVTPQ